MTLTSRSWDIDFNRFSGKSQVRRATLSGDSSYWLKFFFVLNMLIDQVDTLHIS